MMARGSSQSLKQLTYYIDRYHQKKNQNKIFFATVRILVLTLGASIPVLTTTGAESWITAIVGAAIVIVTGIGQVLDPHERYIAFRIAYKSLDRERMLFLAGVGVYGPEDEAETALAAKTADIVFSTEADVISAVMADNGG